LFNIDSTSDNNNTPYQNQQYKAPYTGTTKTGSSNVGLIIGISTGILILIIAIILGVRAFKQNRNVATE
jgi:hypothetical protein